MEEMHGKNHTTHSWECNEKVSRAWFRSTDLWVMGPARFHCATLLSMARSGQKKCVVRSGIRTHAHRSGLRPERSALDLSAILTHVAVVLGSQRPALA